ncbi:MAG: putative bifunctional diguanylate cyclase/phosphodiesterase [Aliihoeflea sp.]
MLQVISCLVYEHDYRYVLLAAVICVAGSLMSMRLFARTRRTTGARRANWLFLAGVVSGSAIWTTHFVAMMGYMPALQHAYDPAITLISLFLAIGFCTIGMVVAASTRTSVLIEFGGAILGVGIAVMHYAGMSAMRVTAQMAWDPTLVAISVALGAFFGAVAMNRIARPVTRFCRYGGALALILGIVSMHFTGMGALTLMPDLSISVPDKGISDSLLILGVLAVMSLVMGTGLSSYLIDNHNEVEAVQRYRQLALHDAVTGLPNRHHLASKLGEIIGGDFDDTSRIAVIAIDLDRFKDINDVHGHAAGDIVLKIIAERLSACLQDGEFLARVGGDEFVAVKTGLYQKSQALEFAARLHAVVCSPVEDAARILTVGASLGVAYYPDDASDASTLLSRADLAMYRAKQSAFTSICRYDSSMDEANRTRSALSLELRHAVERNELELYYQPQNDVASGDLIGFEALVRWNHPQRGLVSPVDFIPLAEETGLILPIGEWVLREACTQAARWSNPYKIAVNVASAQISQSDLPRLVDEILAETGLPASRLELEITESSIIEDHQHALSVVRKLKSRGVSIAMDDYGTGYSSLSTLQNFPFDKIKIDRSFIASIDTSAQAMAIVRSTIILAESLHIPVLAEGVESASHLKFLRDQGCHEAQGYFFGKPVPIANIQSLVDLKVIDMPMLKTA